MKKPGAMDDDHITLLARGVELKGEIRVEGTVRIDGRLHGEVHTTGQVIVGEDGLVTGTIHAGTLICSGRIKATITATERVQLLQPGVVIGEVHCPIFSMEEGAKFQGLSDMSVAAWEEDVPQLPKNVRDLSAHRGKTTATHQKETDS